MRTANLKNLIAACILSLAIICTASGDIIYVNPGEFIQAAIDDANEGDLIEVAPGTYYEAINFNGKAIRLYSIGGPDVTIIDANGLNSTVVKCVSGEDANTTLEGFTITGGKASNGGGMNNNGSNPTVTNCTFSSNSAGHIGGGMFNVNSSPVVTDCTFSGNLANSYCGMYNGDSSPTVTKCRFIGNTAIQYGGGMGNDGGSATVSNCIFINNSAGDWGGGMENFMSVYREQSTYSRRWDAQHRQQHDGDQLHLYRQPVPIGRWDEQQRQQPDGDQLHHVGRYAE